MAASNYNPNDLSTATHLTNNCIVRKILKREKEFNQLSRCNESMEDGLNDDGFVDTSDEEEVGGEYFDNIWSQRQLEEHI